MKKNPKKTILKKYFRKSFPIFFAVYFQSILCRLFKKGEAHQRVRRWAGRPVGRLAGRPAGRAARRSAGRPAGRPGGARVVSGAETKVI